MLVHPGSACGSANYHLGRRAAAECRAEIAALLENWTGGFIVLDGDLSDELPEYPAFNTAISACLRRARRRGAISVRSEAQDPDQVAVIGDLVKRLEVAGQTFEVTGAWYDPTDESGCVNSVVTELARRGFVVEVASAAVVLPEEEEVQPQLLPALRLG